jgi:hypothetical protein
MAERGAGIDLIRRTYIQLPRNIVIPWEGSTLNEKGITPFFPCNVREMDVEDLQTLT